MFANGLKDTCSMLMLRWVTLLKLCGLKKPPPFYKGVVPPFGADAEASPPNARGSASLSIGTGHSVHPGTKKFEPSPVGLVFGSSSLVHVETLWSGSSSLNLMDPLDPRCGTCTWA